MVWSLGRNMVFTQNMMQIEILFSFRLSEQLKLILIQTIGDVKISRRKLFNSYTKFSNVILKLLQSLQFFISRCNCNDTCRCEELTSENYCQIMADKDSM